MLFVAGGEVTASQAVAIDVHQADSPIFENGGGFDLIRSRDDGLYVTETQKTTARVHEIPNALLQSLWGR